ncbi:MAG: SUMF1/EgtB/PvdO family nonheme iron enzyme [Chitinivibrionales bacterium]|nr:SUMF1/EgtB/PvdO family nonheme iron enzyme [Chitinivibrionales bacterium]
MKHLNLLKLISTLCILPLFVSTTWAIESINEILLNGIYRMELYTGDTLEGVVVEKNDSMLIIECQNKPYTFHASLIRTYTVLSADSTASTLPDADSTTLSYDEIYKNKERITSLVVQLKDGSSFRGSIAFIDSSTLKLLINGSAMPFDRENIMRLVAFTKKSAPDTAPQNVKQQVKIAPAPPMDSVFVSQPPDPQTGKGLPPKLFSGMILSDDSGVITLQQSDGSVRTISQKQVTQVIRHSASSYEQKIKKYAQVLICPDDMVSVDLPPGKDNRPFLKACIDRYEYPNKKGVKPTTNVSFNQAQSLCQLAGKRLCTTDEWQWSCSGIENYPYPYGHNMIAEYCNREGVEFVETSGLRLKCSSKFGAYDMVGNVFEWVTTTEKAALMGGPLSKCQTISPGLSGSAKPQIGFRCCKSN